MKRASGFTLIEVMVAMLIVAIALPAVLTALYRQVDGTAYLRDKSIAEWVASNKLAETRIQTERSGSLFQGRRSGFTTMAGRDWYWWLESTETEVPEFHRLEIRVTAEDNEDAQALFKLTGFIMARETDAGGR